MTKGRTSATTAGAAFLLYAGASLTWTLDPQYGLVMLISLTVGYFLGRHMERIDTAWFLFLLLLIANALFSVAFHPAVPYGIFGNPNYLGCAFALAIVACVAYRRWYLFLPAGFVGLAYTQSRAAIAATSIGLFFGLPKFWKVLALIAAMLLFTITFLYRGNSMAESMWQKMGIWEDTINHLTVFGQGFGSYSEAYKSWPKHTNMTLILTNHAYNDYLELIFELGIGAIPLWIVLILLLSLPSPERPIVITFLTMSLTYFPLYIPVVGQLIALTLGHISRREQWQGSAYSVRTT